MFRCDDNAWKTHNLVLGDSWHIHRLFGVSFDHVTAKVAALGGACKDHEECISAGGLNVYSFVYVMCFF